MKLVKIIAFAAILNVLPAMASTDMVTKIGIDGMFAQSKTSSVRTKSKEGVGSFFVALELPGEYTPNIKYKYTGVDVTNIQFTQHDFTLYYQAYDQKEYTFDMGISYSMYEDIELTRSNGSLVKQSDSIINVFSHATILIPNTDLYIVGEFYFGDQGEGKLSTVDTFAALQYTAHLDDITLNTRLGYRVMDYEFNEGTNVTMVDGFFVGLEAEF